MNVFLLIGVLLSSCTRIPEGVKPVENFEINRYMGTWYEIARLDNHFERGLDNISATYTLRADGGIDVLNQGWNPQTGEWEKAEGKGYLIEQADKGRLKVSFFGPLYGAYNIINLDKEDYAYSMVTGPNKSYLWILSRTRQLPKATLDTLINQAKNLGFATDQLIFVKQK
ncbi:MAG: lipocalin family protein [Methylobacter sp.]